MPRLSTMLKNWRARIKSTNGLVDAELHAIDGLYGQHTISYPTFQRTSLFLDGTYLIADSNGDRLSSFRLGFSGCGGCVGHCDVGWCVCLFDAMERFVMNQNKERIKFKGVQRESPSS